VTRYAYEVLVGREQADAAGGVVWYMGSDMREVVGDNLPLLLNSLGDEGWEVVAVGDLGFDARSEILLKRKL
jgi:hypothetical protein